MQASIAPSAGALSYLFPARQSVLSHLAGESSLYAQMSGILNGGPTFLVNMPTLDREAFHSFGGRVESAVRGGFEGGCDLATRTPLSAGTAAAVCTPLCTESGGWNSQWTNQTPPSWPTYSACGCKTCTQTTQLPMTTPEHEAALDAAAPVSRRYLRN